MPSGPRTTSGAGQLIDGAKGRTFPCEQCGADVQFDIRAQRMKCPFCSHERDRGPAPVSADGRAAQKVAEQDYPARLAWLAKVRSGKPAAPEGDVSEVRCEACGANVRFQGPVTATECAFCAAPITREKVHVGSTDRVPVDGVLPFQVEKVRAEHLLRAWVASRWFAPGEFKKRGAEGKFQGVYVPYWTFDADTFSRYVGERGDVYYVTVRTGKSTIRQRRVRWSHRSGTFELVFDDVMVVGATDLPTKLLQKLEPWPLDRCVPFDAQLLAGFAAETYSVPIDAAFASAKERMDEELRAECRRQIGGDEQRIHELESTFDAITYKHLLLPVWLLAYKFDGKVHRVVVNAVTGEVQGTRPWSAWKIAGLVLAILAVIGAIVLAAQ